MGRSGVTLVGVPRLEQGSRWTAPLPYCTTCPPFISRSVRFCCSFDSVARHLSLKMLRGIPTLIRAVLLLLLSGILLARIYIRVRSIPPSPSPEAALARLKSPFPAS